MSDWKKKAHTPEKDAVDVYGTYPDNAERRIAHVDCLRSQVIPRDELIEELVAALATCGAHVNDGGFLSQHFDLSKVNDATTKAHSHGYGKPTES